ncbi:hypothetical protein ABZY36_35430 [Streptomyces sp. NPDC006627]|uniref:hypothetical protein n=1 Tax=Streptomyces sp. NPDC006627 TaxID=3154679 RepID=UPI0033BCFE8C
MHTHDTRPAAVLAWILGVAFVIACPQAVPVVLAAVVWLLTASVGTAVLGIAFAASLLSLARGRGYAVRRSW